MGAYPDNQLRLSDQAVYCGTLALTGGQQVGPHSNVFVDTISATNGAISFSVSDSGTDRVAVAEFNTQGFKKFIFIATTLQGSSTLYVDARLF
jgi:hypothetical protein